MLRYAEVVIVMESLGAAVREKKEFNDIDKDNADDRKVMRRRSRSKEVAWVAKALPLVHRLLRPRILTIRGGKGVSGWGLLFENIVVGNITSYHDPCCTRLPRQRNDCRFEVAQSVRPKSNTKY
jgi:hypothetical protein